MSPIVLSTWLRALLLPRNRPLLASIEGNCPGQYMRYSQYMHVDSHLEAQIRDRGPAYERVVDVCGVKRWPFMHVDDLDVVLDEKVQ